MSRKALGFDDSESSSDEEQQTAITTGVKRKNTNNKDLIAHSLKLQKKSAQLEVENAEMYEYDEVYDKMQNARDLIKKKAESQDVSSPRYVNQLLEAKAQRERDKLKVNDLKIERERELEPEELKNKESFVTSAYKKYQEERSKMDKEEEEEEEKSQIRDYDDNANFSFHKNLLDRITDEHENVIQAISGELVLKNEEKSPEPKKELEAGLNMTSQRSKLSRLQRKDEFKKTRKERTRRSSSNQYTESINSQEIEKKIRFKVLPKLSEETLNDYKERYFQRTLKNVY